MQPWQNILRQSCCDCDCERTVHGAQGRLGGPPSVPSRQGGSELAHRRHRQHVSIVIADLLTGGFSTTRASVRARDRRSEIDRNIHIIASFPSDPSTLVKINKPINPLTLQKLSTISIMTDGNTSKVGSASVYEAKDQVRLASRETPTIVEPRLTRDTASARAAQHCKPQPRVRPGQDQRAQPDRLEYDFSYAAIERTIAPARLTLVQRTSAPSPTGSRQNRSTLPTPTTSPRRTAPAPSTPLCLYV